MQAILREHRKGAGVFVLSLTPRDGERHATDVGPFEHLDARRAIEGEACALAASRITDDQLDELESVLRAIQSGENYVSSEAADRQFHQLIAEATGNSIIIDIVTSLWQTRERSPQYRLLADKAHEAGIGPVVDEHEMIFEALKRRDAVAARTAMRDHLSRVLETLLGRAHV